MLALLEGFRTAWHLIRDIHDINISILCHSAALIFGHWSVIVWVIVWRNGWKWWSGWFVNIFAAYSLLLFKCIISCNIFSLVLWTYTSCQCFLTPGPVSGPGWWCWYLGCMWRGLWWIAAFIGKISLREYSSKKERRRPSAIRKIDIFKRETLETDLEKEKTKEEQMKNKCSYLILKADFQLTHPSKNKCHLLFENWFWLKQ